MNNNKPNLQSGKILQVPDDAVLFESLSQNKETKTPKFLKLQVREMGTYHVITKLHGENHRRGYTIFTPENCKGKALVVRWVDDNCACATFPGNSSLLGLLLKYWIIFLQK